MQTAGQDGDGDVQVRDASPGPDGAPELDRRKIRKGTHSCWECKRRKIKCSFLTPSDSTCVACRKHNIRCVSQKYPQSNTERTSTTADDSRMMGERIVRVEDLVKQLAQQLGNRSDDRLNAASSSRQSTLSPNAPPDPMVGVSVPESLVEDMSPARSNTAPEASRQPSMELGGEGSRAQSTTSWPHVPLTGEPAGVQATTVRAPGNISPRLQGIAAALYTALPPKQDVQLMMQAGIDVSFHNIMMQPYAVIAQQHAGDREILTRRPSETTHPTLIARYMLILATCLQFAHPELHKGVMSRLSEPPQQLNRRLVDLASSLVTNNDELLDSVEGLECIMMESLFEANCGHLRRAWFTCRRAMLVAQMMGFHRSNLHKAIKAIDPTQSVYPNVFWFRIVLTDRQLSLMLGLPQGSLDVSMASEANLARETPEGRLERKQAVIASRVLERNESPDSNRMDDLAALQAMDADLQRAGDEMPAKWWLIPNLTSLAHDPEQIFWATIRMLDQMFYFNLRNIMHLPYMLRSHIPAAVKYDHSKVACTNASRELLARFIMYRSFNRVAFTCRAVDFFAILASMTLVMAHLDAHRRRRNHPNGEVGKASLDILAHQRNSDRAMMEQTLENMEKVAELNLDVLSDRGAILIKSLLAFETDAADDKLYHNTPVAEPAAATQAAPHNGSVTDDGQFLRIGIPYFGTVKISREGLIAMEEDEPRGDTPPSLQKWLASSSSTASVSPQPPFGGVLPEMPPMSVSHQHAPFAMDASQIPSSLASVAQLPATQTFSPHFPSAINDALEQQYLYPSLTAGIQDWTFQGVDMAFFDSLMRHADSDLPHPETN